MTPSPFHGIFSTLSTSGTPRLGSPRPVPLPSPSPTESLGQVALDIFEQDGYYVVKAPIAGVRLQDLDIEVNDNVLTIRGHRHQADSVSSDQYYIQECFWGEFTRSITLPTVIDQKRVRASFNKEGILKIIIPKEEKVKIVRISEG
ncbi:Hsp20/alpha crystallin family protein [Candidatus Peregrinibacteria bacterium]|nr:Hsp20/alpha crystallin family protein [Candidatus Peregrinibacteria bacterium]